MWMPVTNTTKPNESLGNHVIISTGGAPPIHNATTSSSNSDDAYKEKYGSMKVKLKDILYENELFQDELKTLKRELLDIYRDKDSLLQKVLQFEKCSGYSDESDVENPNDKSDQNEVLPIDNAEHKAQDTSPVDQGGLKRKIEADGANNKKICINLTPNVTSNPKPKTTGNRNRKSTPKAVIATNSDPANNLQSVAPDFPTSNKPPPKKNVSNKNVKSEGIESQKPVPVKRERKKPQPKAPKEAKEPKQSKQPKQPKKPTLKQQQQQQQAQKTPQTTTTSQPVTFVHQVAQQQVHLVSDNRLQNQSQKFKIEPQPQQQQLPITVQLGPMSLPAEQIKYIQHVNLPVQNLDSNSMIVTNNTNQIQIQQQQQNHLMPQQPQQMHFQLPQTTLAPVIDAFQTPQSMITTQGNQITFNGQSYTIVSTTSDGTSTLLQHDQIQSQQQQQLNHDSSSPEQQHQMMTQVVPINTMSQHEVNSISPQSIQNHSPGQEQHHQHSALLTPHPHHQQNHQQSHDNSQYQHSLVQFRPNQNNQMHINQHQLQEENVCGDVFEHHLDTRRIEDAALLEEWQAGDLFDNYLVEDKFMVED